MGIASFAGLGLWPGRLLAAYLLLWFAIYGFGALKKLREGEAPGVLAERPAQRHGRNAQGFWSSIALSLSAAAAFLALALAQLAGLPPLTAAF
jgi:hypothetical protein